MGIAEEAKRYGAGIMEEVVDCDFGLAEHCSPIVVGSRDWAGIGRRYICLNCLEAAVDEAVGKGHMAYIHERGHPYCDAILGVEVKHEISSHAG